jgi:hypothetical protein
MISNNISNVFQTKDKQYFIYLQPNSEIYKFKTYELQKNCGSVLNLNFYFKFIITFLSGSYYEDELINSYYFETNKFRFSVQAAL